MFSVDPICIRLADSNERLVTVVQITSVCPICIRLADSTERLVTVVQMTSVCHICNKDSRLN